VTVECDRGELLRKLRVELADLELQLEAHQSGDMRLVKIGMRVREIMGIVTRLEPTGTDLMWHTPGAR
jgi:hypothetical protein